MIPERQLELQREIDEVKTKLLNAESDEEKVALASRLAQLEDQVEEWH